MTEKLTMEGWEAWLKANPEQAAELDTMINQREAVNSLAKAFPMTRQLFERCDEELTEKLVACLRQHEVQIIYPALVARLDDRTRRELGALLDLLRAKKN